jgi:hypothetical protein
MSGGIGTSRGEGKARAFVIPAKAGIPLPFAALRKGSEIPAFAGMTVRLPITLS